MRSRELELGSYDTDKVANRYLDHYDSILTSRANESIKLLEIGIYKGGSLALWRDYFPQGTIVGIDARIPSGVVSEDRVHVFEGDQADIRFLSRVAGETAPEGFDVIIDDASHIGETTRITFWHLFENHLKAGGIYAIEDWGTGYWDDWPDGRCAGSGKPSFFSRLKSLLGSGVARSKSPWPSHSYGMVGFVKELIDEQGAADLTRRALGGRPGRPSRFESMLVAHGLVLIRKAAGNT